MLAVLAASVIALAAAVPSEAATCVPRTNVTAMVDDSGSMGTSDSSRLRVSAIEAFIDQAPNAGKRLTVTEFGDSAQTLFGPTVITTSARTGMFGALGAIAADNGSTDYNAAFSQAAAANPSADARIFLTDGEHNAGPYQQGHRGGPPTYVLGLNVSSAGESLLRQIADETDGEFFPLNFPGDIGPTVNEITSALACLAAPATIAVAPPKAGKTKGLKSKLRPKHRRANVVLFDRDRLNKIEDLKWLEVVLREPVKKHPKIKRHGRIYSLLEILHVVAFGPDSVPPFGLRLVPPTAALTLPTCKASPYMVLKPATGRAGPMPKTKVVTTCNAGDRYLSLDFRTRSAGTTLRQALGSSTLRFGIYARPDAPATGRDGVTVQLRLSR